MGSSSSDPPARSHVAQANSGVATTTADAIPDTNHTLQISPSTHRIRATGACAHDKLCRSYEGVRPGSSHALPPLPFQPNCRAHRNGEQQANGKMKRTDSDPCFSPFWRLEDEGGRLASLVLAKTDAEPGFIDGIRAEG